MVAPSALAPPHWHWQLAKTMLAALETASLASLGFELVVRIPQLPFKHAPKLIWITFADWKHL
jgi:hypothetical protein